jgi:hypothetical protein
MVERIKELRQEITKISAENRRLLGKKHGSAPSDQERRLQRLQEILDELAALTDWKKP